MKEKSFQQNYVDHLFLYIMKPVYQQVMLREERGISKLEWESDI